MRSFRTRWVCDMLSMLIISRYVGTYNVEYQQRDTDRYQQAIDLMTRRLLASGQKPVTVGTFFSLGHST